MNKQSDLELRITNSPARRGETASGPAMELILSLLLFLALFGAVTAAASAAPAALPLPVLAGAAVCAILVFTARAPWKKYVAPALLALLLLLTLIWRGRVTEGMCLLWNRWCTALTVATGRLHLGVTVGGAPADGSLRLALLAAAMLLAVCAVWMQKACPHIAAVICLLLALALALLPGLEGVGIRIALALIAGLALLLVQDTHSGGKLVQRLLPILLAGAVFALLLAGVRGIAPVRDGSLFTELRQKAEETIHTARYEPEAQPLPEGDLTRVGQKPDSATTRLRVSMTQPETLYLRGFVGDEYTGDAWRPVSNAELAADSDLLYWLHRSGFYPQTQASLAGALLDDTLETNTVVVRNLAACSRYVYAPYSLQRSEGLSWLSLNDLDSSTLTSAEGKGAHDYRYTTVYQAPEYTDQWVEALNEAGTAELDAYRAQEAGYRDFVLAHDLALPESTRELLGPILDTYSKDYGGSDVMTPSQAIECVNRFLEEHLTWRTDVPTMDAADDFLAYTLDTLGGGWDVHYATLAVLALRYYGVPARYAEGYIITNLQAAEAGSDWVSLDDSAAAAWAEVYQEGLGWLPLRQTPGQEASLGDAPAAGENPTATAPEPDENSPVGTTVGEGEAAEPLDNTDPETPDEERDVSPEELDSPTQETTEPPPQTAPAPRRTRLLWLLPVLLLLLALAGLYLRRRHILQRRERLFTQDDRAQAVSCLFAYVLRLLEPLSVRAEKGRLLELPPKLAEKLAPDYAERFAEMTELNYRAIFCSKPLPEGAYDEMSALRRETLARLRQGCGVWKRLRLKWLECLY